MLNQYISVKKRTDIEVADVLRQFGDAYREQYPLSSKQARVMNALTACRTAQLGGHVKQCVECGAIEIWYNSCRDRHCPKCEKFRKAQWLERQKVMLLPIPYFHVTFTTDHVINKLVPANQKAIYDLLFKSASDSLKAVGQEDLGGELGITAVLHTWGQKMDEHVHLHCIVTGGVLSQDGQHWHPAQPYYLCDTIALSANYRDRFCEGLLTLYQQGQLKLVGQSKGLDVENMVAQMQAKAWEVYIKPFAKPEMVYEYLSRYVHQVAISNHRLIDIANGKVYFSYHDNKDKEEKGKLKTLALSGVEFVRRFLWHVLPHRYVRIRYYGLHHASARKQKLRQARKALDLDPSLPLVKELRLTDWLESLFGAEAIDRCSFCGTQGSLLNRGEFSELNFLWLMFLTIFKLSGQTVPKP